MIDLAPLAERAARLDIALHTVQVSVAGQELARAVNPPLGLDTPQRMYSVSKTLTGLAVGLLADDGVLSLDDPVVRHFPEMTPTHPWVAATTLRDVLAMRGPHRATTYKRTDGSWLDSYFRVEPTHPPGTLFTYDTSGSYVLSALVERITGATVADFLRPRVLDPLGVSAGLHYLPGPEGISHGGSGLTCTPRDLLRIAQLLVADGVHDGVRLLPAEYLAAATSHQADSARQNWGDRLRRGYGYQLWLPADGAWAMFGLGGQIVYGDPGRGLVVVVTADAQACNGGDQRLLDDLLELVVRPLAARIDAGEQATTDPRQELSWPAPRHDATHARTVVGGRYTACHDAGPRSLDLDLDVSGGRLRTTQGWDLPLRFDGPAHATFAGEPAVVTAGWIGPGTLDVRCAVHGEDLMTLRLRLVWAPDDTLAVQSQAFCETADPAWTFHAAYCPSPAR